MDDLCTNIMERIFSYVHTDELLPICYTCKHWWHLICLRLPRNAKPTYKSITSVSLLDYYAVPTPLTDTFIAKIIRAGGNYDFYDQYLSRMHLYPYVIGMLDDHRYITVHGIEGQLQRQAALKSRHLIPDTIPLSSLEDYGCYIKDVALLPLYDRITGSIRSNIVGYAIQYDNLPLLKTICYNYPESMSYSATMKAYELGTVEVLDFMVNGGFIRQMSSGIHRSPVYSQVAIIYIIDNFGEMRQCLNNEIYKDVFLSEHMTPELATKLIETIGPDNLPSDLDCHPRIAHILEPYISDDAKLKFYITGILTPTELVKCNLASKTPTSDLIDIMRQYGTVYTFRTIPTLFGGHKKVPIIERYHNDPVKFIKQYDKLVNKWVGKISHPDIYKHIVVRAWSNSHEYVGPITNDLHQLAFDKDIGNPLIGHLSLDEFVDKSLTIHERISLLKLRRVDIITKYNVQFRANQIYEYIKYDLYGAGLPLTHFKPEHIHIPLFDFNTVPPNVISRITSTVIHALNPDERILLALGGKMRPGRNITTPITKHLIPILDSNHYYPNTVAQQTMVINALNESVKSDGILTSGLRMMRHILIMHPSMIFKCNKELFEVSKYFIDKELCRCIENIIYGNA